MGFLFQQAALYDSLSVEENVAFPLRHNTELSAGECRKRVDDTRIKTIGLGKAQDTGECYKVEVLVYPAGSGTVAQKPR